MSENEVMESKASDLVPIGESPSPMQLIDRAMSQGADMETLSKLMDLQERYEANEARKAYTVAMAEFKANDLVIEKNKDVHHNNEYKYSHASLDHICAVIRPQMSAQGLSWSWRTEEAENNQVRVTCEITHVLGHCEKTPLSAPNDPSGGKNGIQALGSTVSYLERYTLLAALGLATGGQDTDGVAPDVIDETTISTSDIETIKKAAGDVMDDFSKLFAFMTKKYGYEIQEFGDIRVVDLDRAKFAIQAKKDALNEGA